MIASDSRLAVASDDVELVAGFDWAVRRALDWVQTSAQPGNLPSYWAGYPSRPMFYLRDVAHQSVGAHLLGLDAENFAMLRHFARSATARRGWYPLWSFYFDGSVPELDYRSEDEFVREVPAVFELTEYGVDMYHWTGDERWLSDPDLWRYYEQSLSSFVRHHDRDGDRVPETSGSSDIFAGIATYNEQEPDVHVVKASDGVASQYAALLRFAQALDARGLTGGAAARAEAQGLRDRFTRGWWSAEEWRFAWGIAADGTAVTGYGAEANWFVATKELVAAGPRAHAHLDFIERQLALTPPPNIEGATYLPEVFWRYGRDEQALRWLRYVMASRDDYPEVSYSVVGHVVAGLLGLEPRAGQRRVRTASHLPPGLAWLEIKDVPIGGWRMDVRHDGGHRTALRVTAGPGALEWTAAFRGEHERLLIDGRAVPATTSVIDGQVHSTVRLTVPVGVQATVDVG